MKKQIAAALSITGVLITGSAAAMVNSQALHTDAPVSSAAATTSTTASTLAAQGAAPTTAPSTTLPSTAAPTTVAGAPAGGLAVYQVGDAGTVTLDASGDELVIVSATANPGWVTDDVRHDGDDLTVKVEFVSSTTKVEFRASLLFGVVSTSVESEALAADDGQGSEMEDQQDDQPTGTTVAAHDDDNDDHESDDDGSSEHESGADD